MMMRTTSRSGFTLMEVLVSLAILAGALIPLMQVLGRATEDVYETVAQRRMRYLSQYIVGQIELGKLQPQNADEELPFEEGDVFYFEDEFRDVAEDGEYEGFKAVVEVFRDEVVCGFPDEDAMLDAGFSPNGDGSFTRPVANDPVAMYGESGANPFEMGGESRGQIKRVLVVAIVREGETADQDRQLRIMTYLPHPDEEGGGPGPGSGLEGGGAEGSGAGAENPLSGATPDGSSGGTDK